MIEIELLPFLIEFIGTEIGSNPENSGCVFTQGHDPVVTQAVGIVWIMMVMDECFIHGIEVAQIFIGPYPELSCFVFMNRSDRAAIRVLHVLETFQIGGQERLVLALSREARAHGVESGDLEYLDLAVSFENERAFAAGLPFNYWVNPIGQERLFEIVIAWLGPGLV